MHACMHTYVHSLHYIALHCIAFHYITFHYLTLHYITLHYTTLHYMHSYLGPSRIGATRSLEARTNPGSLIKEAAAFALKGPCEMVRSAPSWSFCSHRRLSCRPLGLAGMTHGSVQTDPDTDLQRTHTPGMFSTLLMCRAFRCVKSMTQPEEFARFASRCQQYRIA